MNAVVLPQRWHGEANCMRSVSCSGLVNFFYVMLVIKKKGFVAPGFYFIERARALVDGSLDPLPSGRGLLHFWSFEPDTL